MTKSKDYTVIKLTANVTDDAKNPSDTKDAFIAICHPLNIFNKDKTVVTPLVTGLNAQVAQALANTLQLCYEESVINLHVEPLTGGPYND